MLVVLNLLVFVALRPIESMNEQDFMRPMVGAVELLQRHPYLTPPPFLEERLAPAVLAELARERAQVSEVPQAEQAALDELVAAAQAAQQKVPSYRYGYRPADKNWSALLTHQFLHGGWLHLLGNLWFLWLTGAVLEDGWGRLAFPAFYLLAGIAGALAHHAMHASSHASLIGASGAIAGLMGAFLIRNAKTRIKFWLLLVVRPIRFAAPAYLVLPLWFVAQVGWGLVEQQGVAYFAHVGGFVFGVGSALWLKHSGREQLLDRAIENRGAILEDPAVAEAARLIDQGQVASAVTRLEALVQAEPRRLDAWLELLRASSVLGDRAREHQVKLKLIELYLQQGLGEGALALYAELGESERLSLPPALRLRLGRQYERAGQFELAQRTFAALHTASRQSSSFDYAVVSAAMIAHAELALKLGYRGDALQLWAQAEAFGDPQCTQIVRDGLARARALPG